MSNKINNEDIPIKLLILRLIGYIGACANALIVPLIVWNNTNSSFITGIGLFIEWIPKLWAYMSGGSFSAKIGTSRAHKYCEITRIISMIVLSISAFYGYWILAIIVAPFMQMSNAIGNISFEALAHRYGIKAHTKMMQMDFSASILLVPLAWILSTWQLALFCSLIHLICYILIKNCEKNKLYDCLSTNEAISIKNSIKIIFKRKELISLSLAGLCFGTPIAAIFSFLPSLLSHAGSGWGQAGFISSFAAIRSIISILFIPNIVRLKCSGNIIIPAILVFLTSFIFLIEVREGYLVLILLILAGLAHSSFNIWTRQTRQGLLNSTERLSLSGVLISMEACAYLLGALVIAFSPSGKTVLFICLTSIPFGVLSCILALNAQKKYKLIKQEQLVKT